MSETYKQRLCDAMAHLVIEKTFSLLDRVLRTVIRDVSDYKPHLQERCIELPVFEETQTGIALGMGLSGKNVISIYPRFDFYCRIESAYNHSDKLAVMSAGVPT